MSSTELQGFTRGRGYQSGVPEDFPKINSSANAKFAYEVNALISAWKSHAKRLNQIEEEESRYKNGCCFKAHSNRYVVCPIGSVTGCGGFGAAGAGGFLMQGACGIALSLSGFVVGAIGTGAAMASLTETPEIDDFAERKLSVENDKDKINKRAGFLNSVAEFWDQWNKFSKDLSEKSIVPLFTAFENVQKAEMTLLTDKPKENVQMMETIRLTHEVETLFLMVDIVRNLKTAGAGFEIVNSWKAFKKSPLTHCGDKHFAHSLEKFVPHQISPESYSRFFITRPLYLSTETQVGKKISAAQVYSRG